VANVQFTPEQIAQFPPAEPTQVVDNNNDFIL